MPISELHQHHTSRIAQSFLSDFGNMAKSIFDKPSRARPICAVCEEKIKKTPDTRFLFLMPMHQSCAALAEQCRPFFDSGTEDVSMGQALHETAQAAALARLVQENSPEHIGRVTRPRCGPDAVATILATSSCSHSGGSVPPGETRIIRTRSMAGSRDCPAPPTLNASENGDS